MSIIAISGKSGCGNTTVSRLVASALGYTHINYTFRAMAAEMGVPLEQLLAQAQHDFSLDRHLDTYQAALARSGNTVIGSRLAMWMIPEADLKVYLKASEEVRAARIHAREGGDRVAIERFTRERDARDRARYLTLYQIDIDDVRQAHLVIDTEKWSAEDVAMLIVDAFRAMGRSSRHE
ncbi:MAG: cytidylate kinase family protein [Rectinema sp.]|nr:cytidylate kinase family protein [Rectinema sp.]